MGMHFTTRKDRLTQRTVPDALPLTFSGLAKSSCVRVGAREARGVGRSSVTLPRWTGLLSDRRPSSP